MKRFKASVDESSNRGRAIFVCSHLGIDLFDLLIRQADCGLLLSHSGVLFWYPVNRRTEDVAVSDNSECRGAKYPLELAPVISRGGRSGMRCGAWRHDSRRPQAGVRVPDAAKPRTRHRQKDVGHGDK